MSKSCFDTCQKFRSCAARGPHRFQLRTGENPKVIGELPICAAAASRREDAEFKVHEAEPETHGDGITSMLAATINSVQIDYEAIHRQPCNPHNGCM